MPSTDDFRRQARHMLDEYDLQLANQRRRADEGLALGTPEPFPTGRDDPIVLSHMTIDRGLAALVSGDGPGGMADKVGQAVRGLLDEASDDGRGEILANDDWIDRRTFHRLHMLGQNAFFDGEDVAVASDWPGETIAGAAAGQRLGDFVDVPACLADHVIERWGEDDDTGWSRIRIRPELVGIEAFED